MNNTPDRVFVTKWALTKGILEVKLRPDLKTSGTGYLARSDTLLVLAGDHRDIFVKSEDFFYNLDEAQAKVDKARLASLEQSIERLKIRQANLDVVGVIPGQGHFFK